MTTHDNGCVETPEWSCPVRPCAIEAPVVPPNVVLSDN